MNVIATKDIALLRYLLGSPLTAPELYRQIRASFPNSDIYKFFAEPIILEGGKKIAWGSSYAGNVLSYARLSEQDKDSVQDMINESITNLTNAIKQFNDKKLEEFIGNCIEVPGLDSIYLVTNGTERHVVASQWGFVPDTPGAERGLLKKFLGIKKVPMKFNVVYSDNYEPAPFENIVFDIAGKQCSATSDADGVVVLEKVKVDSTVKAFEASDSEFASPQIYQCMEGGQYTINVTPKGNMQFVVQDQFGNPLSNMGFVFDYSGQRVSAVSNADGGITLLDIKNSTRVEAFQLDEAGNKSNENVYVFQRVSNPYLIVVQVEVPVEEKPKTHDMRFKVVDEKNNVVRNAEVTVKYDGKTEVLITDSEGYAELKNVPVGVEVVAKAKTK